MPKVRKRVPNLKQEAWEKTPMYREAVLLKIIRAMKSYGYCEWMQKELKEIGLSI